MHSSDTPIPGGPHGLPPGPRGYLPHGNRQSCAAFAGTQDFFSAPADVSSARPDAPFRRQRPRYLWKKNFMHQQNTGTSRMTTYRRVI